MKQRIFTFLIIVAVGIMPISIAHNDGISIRIELIEPDGDIHFGDVIKLKCYVDGIDSEYLIQWQRLCVSDDIKSYWKNLDCIGDEYSFVLSKENIKDLYRVVVMALDAS